MIVKGNILSWILDAPCGYRIVGMSGDESGPAWLVRLAVNHTCHRHSATCSRTLPKVLAAVLVLHALDLGMYIRRPARTQTTQLPITSVDLPLHLTEYAPRR